MQYKFKNSKHKILNIEEIKGSVFIFRNKKEMSRAKGIVLTSEEALEENKTNITHWTPNTYRYGTYIDNTKITVGHNEKNLRQINTFYIDIDDTKTTETEILSVAYETKLLPTMIIKTTRGYQIYYILKEPVYITKNTDYKVIEVAKRISKNLREYYAQEKIKVDTLCNHFGIARFPTKENIAYLNKENTYTFSELLDWSIKEEDSIKNHKTNKLIIIKGNKGISQVEEKWFKLLLNSTQIKGTKDLLGRNNAIFTLALACYSSGITIEECEEKLQIFNTNLEKTLNEKEYERIINSAYSGKYTAASREYIEHLCKNWIDSKLKSTDLFTNQIWFKFKKKRNERKRSHFEEWEKDIIKYIEKQNSVYFNIKKKDLIEELRIPKRSLDTVLKRLQEKNIIFYKATSGRLGGIKIALTKKIYSYTIGLIKTTKEKYIMQLAKFFEKQKNEITKLLTKYQNNNIIIQNNLFEEDVGYILTS